MKSGQYRGVLVIFVGAGIAVTGVTLSNVFAEGWLHLFGSALFWMGWLVGGLGLAIHLRAFVKNLREQPEPPAKQPWEK